MLSDFQVTVPELGTFKAKHMPLVVLTSNNARELSRRAQAPLPASVHRLPDAERELEIIRLGAGGPERLAPAVVAAVQKIRALELRKSPSVSERSTGPARW